MDLITVLDHAAEKISNKYRVTKEEAFLSLKEKADKNPEIEKAVRSQDSLEKVERLSVYKSFIKSATKDVYYSLRQYHQTAETPQEEHLSTKERLQYEKEFFEQLISFHPDVRNILDVGGGVFPLTFPFEKYPNLKNYIWVDRDKKAYESLKKLNNDKLVLYNENIGSRPWKEYLPESVSKFDLALMIKLVSVINRQERNLISFLAEVPAENILITAPKEAMAKRENVSRREEKVLKDFIDLTGREVGGKLDIENEFGYFLR